MNRRIRIRHPYLEPTVRPRCTMCRKGLTWDLKPVKGRLVKRRDGRKFRVFVRRPASEWNKLAIRCADCFHVYCRRCARKHFVPVFRVQERVLKRLDRVVEKALKGVTCA